ncbi:MAG TPA: phospho-sugar mutase [Bacillota bacterium]
MSWKLKAKKWQEAMLNDEMIERLNDLCNDEKALEECFYTDLQFGTGGMRGILGVGTNRMNIYMVRKVAEGLARFMNELGEEVKRRGVVIAYDSRHKSKEFALEVAKTVGERGIKTYLFDGMRPTPELSFAVRYLHAFSGVVITASHNPPQYNGIKLYGEDGAQITPEASTSIIQQMETIDELSIEVAEEQQLVERNLLTYIGEEIDRAYIEQLLTIRLNEEVIRKTTNDLKIVFTPLHGTAAHIVPKGLRAYGFQHITVVKEQADADPNFSTVQLPNPEEHDAFTMAMEYGKREDADLLLGTDPDADRLGVAVKNAQGVYEVLTGNQLGALMLHYMLSQKQAKQTLPNNGVVIKTIVTSELGRAIATDFGLKTIDTLTGFKYIAEKIKQYESTGTYTFQFGYEESYGYLIADFVRDKDAVQAALFITEVAAYYKQKGMSLYDALQALFERYGFYKESLHSLTLEGKEGAQQMKHIFKSFRTRPLTEIAGIAVKEIEDYTTGERYDLVNNKKEELHLPRSNVLKYKLIHDQWICIRPSGTEPKLKFYYGVKQSSEKASEAMLKQLEQFIKSKMELFLK